MWLQTVTFIYICVCVCLCLCMCKHGILVWGWMLAIFQNIFLVGDLDYSLLMISVRFFFIFRLLQSYVWAAILTKLCIASVSYKTMLLYMYGIYLKCLIFCNWYEIFYPWRCCEISYCAFFRSMFEFHDCEGLLSVIPFENTYQCL